MKSHPQKPVRRSKDTTRTDVVGEIREGEPARVVIKKSKILTSDNEVIKNMGAAIKERRESAIDAALSNARYLIWRQMTLVHEGRVPDDNFKNLCNSAISQLGAIKNATEVPVSIKALLEALPKNTAASLFKRLRAVNGDIFIGDWHHAELGGNIPPTDDNSVGMKKRSDTYIQPSRAGKKGYTVYLTQAVADELKETDHARNTTITELFQQAVEALLERERPVTAAVREARKMSGPK